MELSLVDEIFAIRSRPQFSHDDIKFWVIKVFKNLFGIPYLNIKTEVVIFGKTKGRTDIIADDYIGVETKKSMINEGQDALEQVERFLTKFEEDKNSIMPIGIATDGEKWEFFIKEHGRLFSFHQFDIKKTWQDRLLSESLLKALTTIRAANAGGWKMKPTTEAVADVFRPEGPVFKKARQFMVGGALNIVESNKVEFTSKFVAWLELFSYVYNNFETRCNAISEEVNDLVNISASLLKNPILKKFDMVTVNGALELFFRHTYMALLSKILITNATLGESEISKNLIREPSSIANGKFLYDHGIIVTEVNDFFSWISFDQEIGKLVASILRPLRRFSQDYDDDIFRHLYEMIVDPATRHELGEFYTPKWLAQLIVEETIINGHEKVLDPACGSGTFLVAALKRKAELIKKKHQLSSEQLSKFLEETWGIDVNPLSVLLARTNLYLAILNLSELSNLPEEIKPRIYVADTFILPRFIKEQEIALEIDPNTKIINVPVTSSISIPISIGLDVDEMHKFVTIIGDRILEGLPKLEKSNTHKFEEYLISLDETMRNLKNRYGNNLWQFILRNYCIPPLIRKKFDVVIGNPPWLIFREAKSNIQETIESIASSTNVIPNIKVKTSFNLAISFLLASLQFLKINGTLGFVLPLSVIESAAHYPFIQRMQSGKFASIKSIYDLSKIQPAPFPHSLAPCVFILENLI